MTSEGSREIEAARKRLTAAKTQASAASKHKEMIAKLMESANEMSNIANEEVKEAETMLKDAEKRWEVIDIEQEPDDSHKKNDSNKRRKVSVSPQTNNNNAQSVGVDRLGSANSTADSAITSSSSNEVDQIIVSGCGTSQFNGVYNLVSGFRQYDAPVYTKKEWGPSKDCVIYRGFNTCRGQVDWYIGHWNGDVKTGSGEPHCRPLYGNFNQRCDIPPEREWQILNCSTEVAIPICRPATTQFIIEGCGTAELNGTYNKVLASERFNTYKDAPVYRKRGVWKGKDVTFSIFRQTYFSFPSGWMGSWYIGHGLETGTLVRMFDANEIEELVPPQNGWHLATAASREGGVYPAPTCRPIDNRDKHC